MSFTTKLPQEYVVTSMPIAIPARLSRLGLSEVVNTLLEDLETPVPFDFLIAGELLRSSVADHVAAKGMTTEDVVVVEYIFLPSKPEEDDSIPHEDWVAGVCVLDSGARTTSCRPLKSRGAGTSAVSAKSVDGPSSVQLYTGLAQRQTLDRPRATQPRDNTH